MDKNTIISRVRKYETEERFLHTLRMTELAVSLADCLGEDRELTWLTGMLHDIAKNMSHDEMSEIAEGYGYVISGFSERYRENMHAEIGALIAEHEFGLKDVNALNAIKYHFSGRPDMSVLEKIIWFSDCTEPGRPSYPEMRALYDIAKTDIDLAILRLLRIASKYQEKDAVPQEIRERFDFTFDYILQERRTRGKGSSNILRETTLLSDHEFDDAIRVSRKNSIGIKSVENIRYLGGFSAHGGRVVKRGRLIRSGLPASITEADAEYLKAREGLSLIIDLRSPEEVQNAPDKMIQGVKYENIPLAVSLSTERMDHLTVRYLNSETKKERAWFLSEYAKIGEVRKMYQDISVNPVSREAIRRIFSLLAEERGTVLFHCTSGKDRTGIIAALILKALGCSDDDIVHDYNASAVAYFSKAEIFQNELKKNGYSPALYAGLQSTLSVVPDVITSGLRYISENYSPDEDFVREATGLDSSAASAFRDNYLE